MIKAVIFDLWETLVFKGGIGDHHKATFKNELEELRSILNIKDKADFIVRYEKATQLKKFNSEYELYSSLCREFDVNPEKKLINKLINAHKQEDLKVVIYPEMIDILRKLKDNNYKTALISNTNNLIVKPLHNLQIQELFDVILFSFETKLLKPDPKVFLLALKNLRVNREEAVMIGDSLRSDIKGAESVNIKAIYLETPEQVVRELNLLNVRL